MLLDLKIDFFDATINFDMINKLNTTWDDYRNFLVKQIENVDIHAIHLFSTIYERNLTDRKHKGIFYTPTEITEYMSARTILDYLSTKLATPIASVDKLISDKTINHNQVLELLDDITILDPACGAGEFLLATAKVLFTIQTEILKHYPDLGSVQNIKEKILMKNLFGVDLQLEAVALTKLRLWLWFLSEPEESLDRAHKLLLKMDFNFAVGNSLIGSNDIFDIYKTNSFDEDTIDNYVALFNDFSERNKTIKHDKVKMFINGVKKIIDEENLANKLFSGNQILKTNYSIVKDIILNEDLPLELYKDLLKLYSFLEATRHYEIDLIFLGKLNKGKKKQISFEEYSQTKAFHWSVIFERILANGGFDLVIGNPPYIDIKKIKDKVLKEIYSREYTSAFKLYDISILFLERSYMLLKEAGFASFIITNKFFATDSSKKIREFLLQKTKIHSIIDVSYLPIFYKTFTYPIIFTFEKVNAILTSNILSNKIRITTKLNDFNQLTTNQTNDFLVRQQELFDLPQKQFVITEDLALIQKMNSLANMRTLDQLGTISYRLLGFTNWIQKLDLVSQKKTSSNDLKFIGTTNVAKYAVNEQKEITLAKRRFASNYMVFDEQFADAWKIFKQPKLLVREIAKELTVALDSGVYANITGLYMFIPFNESYLKVLLVILNSTLLNRYFSSLYGSTHMAGGYLRFNGSYLKQLPIVLPTTPISIKAFDIMAEYLLQLNSYKINCEYNELLDSNLLQAFTELADLMVKELYFSSEINSDIATIIANQLQSIEFK
ncbi:MAG: Eco57I restriction-modification methylase domain-containing protein, partial [Candidatus Heimdallarchaeota archaeon]